MPDPTLDARRVRLLASSSKEWQMLNDEQMVAAICEARLVTEDRIETWEFRGFDGARITATIRIHGETS